MLLSLNHKKKKIIPSVDHVPSIDDVPSINKTRIISHCIIVQHIGLNVVNSLKRN